MKKKLLTLGLIALMTVTTAACNTTAQEPGDTGTTTDSGVTNTDRMTAYQRLQEAESSLDQAGSAEKAITVDTQVASGTETVAALRSNGTVREVGIAGTNPQLEVDMNTSARIMGEEEVSHLRGYCQDGIFYGDIDGNRIQAKTEIEEVINGSYADRVAFRESDILTQSVNGNTLRFTISGNAVERMLRNQLSHLQDMVGDEITINTVDYTVELHNNGNIRRTTLEATADLQMDAAQATMTCHIVKDYSNIGQVIIDFPADLSSYVQGEMENFGPTYRSPDTE